MKCIVVDLYEVSDEFMKEHQLRHKNRLTIFRYDLRIIEDFAVSDNWKKHFKIGMVIENWKEFMEGVVNGES